MIIVTSSMSNKIGSIFVNEHSGTPFKKCTLPFQIESSQCISLELFII